MFLYEGVTEKFFDGVAGFFGKGAADDVVEGIAKRLAKDETVQDTLTEQEIHRLRNELEQYQRQHQTQRDTKVDARKYIQALKTSQK